MGALALDSDVRYFISFVRERVHSSSLTSHSSLYQECDPLARLIQITNFLNVDDVEDVVDLVSSLKRKNELRLSMSEIKGFLSVRIEFEGRRINDLLKA